MDSSQPYTIVGPAQQITGFPQKSLLRPIFVDHTKYRSVSFTAGQNVEENSGNHQGINGTWVNKRPEVLSNGMALPRTLMSHAVIPPDLLRPRAHTNPAFQTNVPLNSNGMIPPPLTNDPSPRSSISSLSSMNSSALSPRLIYGLDGLPYLLSSTPQYSLDGPQEIYFPSANDIEEASAMEILRKKQLLRAQKLTLNIPAAVSEESRIFTEYSEDGLSSIYSTDLQPMSPNVQTTLPARNNRRVSFMKTVMVARTWSSHDYDRTPIRVEPFTDSDLLELSNPLVLHYILERSSNTSDKESRQPFSPPPSISEIPYEDFETPSKMLRPALSLPPTLSESSLEKYNPVGHERKEKVSKEKRKPPVLSSLTTSLEPNAQALSLNAQLHNQSPFSPLISPPPTISPAALGRYNSISPPSPTAYTLQSDATPPSVLKSFSRSTSKTEHVKQIPILKSPPTIPLRNSYNINPNFNASTSHLNSSSPLRISRSKSKQKDEILPENDSAAESRAFLLSAKSKSSRSSKDRQVDAYIAVNEKSKISNSQSSVIELYNSKFENEDNDEFVLTPIRSQLRHTDSTRSESRSKIIQNPAFPTSQEVEEDDEDEDDTQAVGEQQQHRRRRRRKRTRSRKKKQTDQEGDTTFDSQVDGGVTQMLEELSIGAEFGGVN
ncbi:hypothetical protein HK098_003260 [Nowakowskiella sp. JEL0407]|nr:hypothetical protein HK098_003260 [Nowakowskiella sp. JEL0407]